MSEVIKLENVVYTMRGNRRALGGLSLCVRDKERVRICGDSGATNALMRLIAGIEPPSSGTVIVLNQSVHAMSSAEAAHFRNRYIGVVLQEPGLMDNLSVAENVSLPLLLRGISKARGIKEAADLLKTLGMYHVAQAKPAQLSLYEARVAGIARTLIAKPQIVMVCNVMSFLSEREAEKLTETLQAMSGFGDLTMLYFGDNAKTDTNRTIQLENGKIREDIK